MTLFEHSHAFVSKIHTMIKLNHDVGRLTMLTKIKMEQIARVDARERGSGSTNRRRLG